MVMTSASEKAGRARPGVRCWRRALLEARHLAGAGWVTRVGYEEVTHEAEHDEHLVGYTLHEVVIIGA